MKNYIPLLVALLCAACVEPFNPNLNAAADVMVIEGYVLEGKIPAEVRLSRTFEVGSADRPVVSGAQVVIHDDQGGEFFLSEIRPGVYQSDTNLLTGTPDLSYQLKVTTSEGAYFESAWEKLSSSSPIERLYYELEDRPESAPGSIDPGLRIYLDTRDPENDSRYYRWEWEETWEFTMPYAVFYTWNLVTNRVEPIPEEEWGFRCWRDNRSDNIQIATTAQLQEDKVERFPLRFVSFRDNRISRKYSLFVKQYVITQAAHSYWKALESLNENLGTLFDPIPYEIIGNLRSPNDPDLPVIGYFSACGFTTGRMWITRQELPLTTRVARGFESCRLDSIPTVDRDLFVTLITQGGYAYVDTILSPFGSSVGWQVAPRYCVDCRESGSNQQPDFWE